MVDLFTPGQQKPIKALAVKALAACTLDFLEKHRTTLDLPFISDFPHNACETTSLLLGQALLDVYPDSSAMLVHANILENGSGEHYWISIEHQVFDLTAHQFPEYPQAIIGLHQSEYIRPGKFCIIGTESMHEVLQNHEWLQSGIIDRRYLAMLSKKIIRNLGLTPGV